MTSASKLSALASSVAYAETFVPQPPGCQAARDRALDLGLVSVSEGVVTTIGLLARIIGAKNVVEIGTGTGVATLALLAGMAPDGVLTSIDPENELQLVAREILNAQGVPFRRARLIAGQPLVVLPKLTDQAYDLLFVNGDPLEYVEYVDQATRLLRPGGLLVVHHALWNNTVADDRIDADEPFIIREALAAVSEMAVPTALWPIGDGLLIAVIGEQRAN